MTDTSKLPTAKQIKINPIVASLPEYLKDPNNYRKIRKAILEAGATKHSHGDIAEWHACKHCTQKQIDRLNMMKKLGFHNSAQYMAWQKIHEEIKRRHPLIDWNA